MGAHRKSHRRESGLNLPRYASYLAWAESQGWTVSVCARPELTFDLDTPEDWAAWNERRPSGRLALQTLSL